MKARVFVTAMLAMAVVLAVWGQIADATPAAAADDVPGPSSFEDWIMQQGDVALQIDHRHRIFQHGMKNGLFPIGPLAQTEYCVGDYCQAIELQWFEGPYDWLGTGASWERWVCYGWVSSRTVACLPYSPTPYP